jgi:prepilin-type N-terminal cleavage/methylation domain-containing protein
MPSMNLISSVKTSRTFISTDGCPKGSPAGNSGFTLLELIISMTIISMIVLVLYFAFSIGARSWEGDDSHSGHEVRLEATLRLVEDDLQNAVPYNMNWETKEMALFTGGPRSVFYVTGNGTGAFSGAGAGLFFSILYINSCPETTDDCLYLYKSPRPCPEFVRTVDQFKSRGELQRDFFEPGTEIANKSILIVNEVENFNISYSKEQFIPFAGPGYEEPETYTQGDDVLPEEHWMDDELPGQLRFAFSARERKFVIQVPVGSR